MPVALALAETGKPAAENGASPPEEPLRCVRQASGASLARRETQKPAGIASEEPPAALLVEAQLAQQQERSELANHEAGSRR